MRLRHGAVFALVAWFALTPVWTASAAERRSVAAHMAYATYYHPSSGNNCGTTRATVGSRNVLALNLYRSARGGVGAYADGRNCGRFVRVTIRGKCVGGTNDGALGKRFCRGGHLVRDRYSGAHLSFVVADSCPDDNGWCRQDRYHLDLSARSLEHFVKNGKIMSGLSSARHWNNRRVQWSFVSAPGYHGDLRIGFRKDAQRYWPAITLTHLRNGVHAVVYRQGGRWHRAGRMGSVGQQFVLGATVAHGRHFRIKVLDAHDHAVAHGRVYSFRLPAACAQGCSAEFTPVRYSTS